MPRSPSAALAEPAPLWPAVGRAAARAAAFVDRRRVPLLGALVALNALAIAVQALHSFPHNGWYFYDGGDGTWYWTAAWDLTSLHVPQALPGFVMPILLAPAAAIAGPNQLFGMPYVLVLYAGVLSALGVVLFYKLASTLAGRVFGIWATALWVVTPVVSPHLFGTTHRAEFRDLFMPGARGLNLLADFPSTICCIAAAWMVVRTIQRPSRNDALAAGILSGLALGIKPANTLFVVAAVLGLVAARRLRELPFYFAALVPAVLTLALWKDTGDGKLPILGSAAPHHEALGVASILPQGTRNWIDVHITWSYHHLHQNFDQIREVFWSRRLLEYVLVAGSIALIRRARSAGFFVFAWWALYVLIKGGVEISSVTTTSFWRLTEPGFPAFVLMAAAVPLLWPRGPQWRPAMPSFKPVGRRALVVLAVLACALPLAVVAIASPAPTGKNANMHADNVDIPVIDSMHVRARRVGPHSDFLVWKRPAGNGSIVFFRIYPQADGACNPSPGAGDCNVTGQVIQVTFNTHVLIHNTTQHWYRIAVALSALNPGEAQNSNEIMISPPVQAR